jgi:hypothetical protein
VRAYDAVVNAAGGPVSSYTVYHPNPVPPVIAAPVLNNGLITGFNANANTTVPLSIGRVINTGIVTHVSSIGALFNSGTVLNSVILLGTNAGTIQDSTVSNLVNKGAILGGTVNAVSGTGVVGAVALTPQHYSALAIGANVTNPVTFVDPYGQITILPMANIDLDTTPLIQGLVPGSGIILQGTVADAATLNAAGTLTALRDGTVVATLELGGSLSAYGAIPLLTRSIEYIPDPFHPDETRLIALPTISATNLVLSSGSVGAGTIAPGPGTGSGNHY